VNVRPAVVMVGCDEVRFHGLPEGVEVLTRGGGGGPGGEAAGRVAADAQRGIGWMEFSLRQGDGGRLGVDASWATD